MKKLKHTIVLLDLGAASVKTKGRSGRLTEDAECLLPGKIICP